MINKKAFINKNFTIDGKQRAYVELNRLETLWFNTGTLCNLKCNGCYIESSPTNKSLEYIKIENVRNYINEIIYHNMGTKNIGLTGGEPFMNPDIIEILKFTLGLGFDVLVLSNGLRPIEIKFKELLKLSNKDKLTIRISIDHNIKELHERIRGKNTWDKLMNNIKWLCDNGFNITIASRIENNEEESFKRLNFQKLFKKLKVKLNAFDKSQLILFPFMDSKRPAVEITKDCWKILGKKPSDVMCSNSRMIVKKKDEKSTKVLACTLITKSPYFELGKKLNKAKKKVFLNHPFCSQFCVLGGSSCS